MQAVQPDEPAPMRRQQACVPRQQTRLSCAALQLLLPHRSSAEHRQAASAVRFSVLLRTPPFAVLDLIPPRDFSLAQQRGGCSAGFHWWNREKNACLQPQKTRHYSQQPPGRYPVQAGTPRTFAAFRSPMDFRVSAIANNISIASPAMSQLNIARVSTSLSTATHGLMMMSPAEAGGATSRSVSPVSARRG